MDSSARDLFSGRDLVIATMHRKEQVIAPLLIERLGVKVVMASGLDTDIFGTFSGEIPRSGDIIETARKKCLAASVIHKCPLVIASEGSFGPHPAFFFAPCDDELLLFMDLENEIEVKARKVTANTNFNGRLLYSWSEAEKFIASVNFPSHGLIVRKNQHEAEGMVKGIHDPYELKSLVDHHLHTSGHVFIETDMRAMHNPTRMKVIKSVTLKLLDTLERTCPQCGIPGMDVVEIKEGLPCELCGLPTRSTVSHIYGCMKCGCRKDEKFPHGKTKESPMYCDYCNP